MNAIINAHQVMQLHLDTSLASLKPVETLRKELLKLDKKDLVEKIIALSTINKVKVEDVVQPILADEACSWLSMEEIATAIAERMHSNTSHKSISSYASKYPKEKGWVVCPRKSSKERFLALQELLSKGGTK